LPWAGGGIPRGHQTLQTHELQSTNLSHEQLEAGEPIFLQLVANEVQE
jgi:hypothetical protein